MPFKPKAGPEDYPEQFQARPRNGEWIEKHQEKNMRQGLGEAWNYLEKIERAVKGNGGSKNMSNLHREIIAFSILALMVLLTAILCHNQTMQNNSIDKVIEARVAQEFRERYRNVPRIVIDRGTVYAGSGEVVIEEVGK